VKIPHLNDYDLARVTVLPFELQWYELERMKSTWAPYSYSYVKNQVLDILNIIPGPFGEGPRTPWHVIEQGIRRAAKSPEAIAANLGVAKALYEYADELRQSQLMGDQRFRSLIPAGQKTSQPQVGVLSSRSCMNVFVPHILTSAKSASA
jgi:hypothetical protein